MAEVPLETAVLDTTAPSLCQRIARKALAEPDHPEDPPAWSQEERQPLRDLTRTVSTDAEMPGGKA